MSYQGTHTSDGFIPHKEIRIYTGQKIKVPVKLRRVDGTLLTNKKNRPKPEYHNGQLVYALPGGRSLRWNATLHRYEETLT